MLQISVRLQLHVVLLHLQKVQYFQTKLIYISLCRGTFFVECKAQAAFSIT